MFTSASGYTYEWSTDGKAWRVCISNKLLVSRSLTEFSSQLSLLNGREVGRSHSRSLGLIGSQKHKPYLEFIDDPNILNDLDELVATFVYIQIRREKDDRARNSSAASGAAAGASC